MLKTADFATMKKMLAKKEYSFHSFKAKTLKVVVMIKSKKMDERWVWGHTWAISTFGKLRQKDQEFKDSLGYIASSGTDCTIGDLVSEWVRKRSNL